MATDYYIWIKSKGGNGFQSESENTKPFDSRENENGEGGSLAPYVSKTLNAAQSFSNGGFQSALNTGVSAITKAFPWIAIAIAVSKMAMNEVSTQFSNINEFNGDYRFQTAFDNVKAAMGNIINPFGLAKYNYNFIEQKKEEDKATDIRRTLTGATTLTALTNKGV